MSDTVKSAERVVAELKALEAGMTRLNAAIAKTVASLGTLLVTLEEASKA